jgi:hypothetical protein
MFESPSRPAAVDGPPRTARASLHVPADLTMYAALAGRLPQIDPTLADPMVAATRAVRANPWSPAAVGVYLREVVRAKGPRLNRPEVAAWVRRQSATARRRLAETHSRMTGGVVLTMSPSTPAEDDEA